MHTLPLSFALLTYTGYWRPLSLARNSFKFWLYNAYSIFMVLLLHTFAFCGIIDSFLSQDLDTMIDKFSLFISVVGVCCKVANLFLRRDRIVGVTNILLKERCIPRDKEETLIKRKFDRHARKLTIYCEILNESAVCFATVAQYPIFLSSRSLPLSDWLPYDVSSDGAYIFTVLHQTIGLMICANASVAHESMISGMMIQICSQLEIICHRARLLPNLLIAAKQSSNSEQELKTKERKIIGDLIEHHLEIYKFATTVNSVFNLMIFVQFSISSTVLCLSVYKMSTTNPFTVEFAWGLSYLGCMLMQVYLYCWFGNEVTLKAMQVCDAVYEMDWTTLPVNLMKDLLLIMSRSRRPLKMSSGHMVTLSTESFMSILKISYSSYNLLKDSS